MWETPPYPLARSRPHPLSPLHAVRSDRMPAQLTRRIEQIAEALVDADIDLAVEVAGLVEQSKARAWKGQVLVEWERDEDAGGCLLRPDLIERLLKLGATFIEDRNTVKL